MKKANLKIFITALHVMFFMSFSAQAQVGIGTTSPDASSMLDIQSPDNDKGVLIPRMTTAQRLLVKDPVTGKPANGLLVFDTTTKSFWFYNGNATTPAWKELVSGSSIVDADGDTKVEVEKSADEDKIHLSTANAAGDASVERMTIDKNGKILMGTDLASQATTYFEIGTDGVIKFGNKGASTTPDSDVSGLENYTKITADGSLSYAGNATRWEDLKVPVNAVKVKGTDTEKTPDWQSFRGSNLGLLFFKWNVKNIGEEEGVVFTVQLPHAWKEGSAIYPHVHWTANTAPGAGRVNWALEYTWVNVGVNFPAPLTISSTDISGANNTSLELYEHVITPLGAITPTTNNDSLSSMIVCRLYRKSSDSIDTFGSDAALLEIDFHYQVDSDGSNQEYTKE